MNEKDFCQYLNEFSRPNYETEMLRLKVQLYESILPGIAALLSALLEEQEDLPKEGKDTIQVLRELGKAIKKQV